MQNWRDNAQAELPGFRERVVQIKLARGEGGMNLTMDGDKISDLNARGAYAGERLAELFSGPPDGGAATHGALERQPLRALPRGDGA